MKKNIPAYLNTLSDDSFEILEEIFSHKYSKFLYLYWLIRDYSDSISSFQYKESDNNVLKIDIVIEKKKPTTVMKEISSNASDDKNLLLYNDGKTIHIEITDCD
jgi:hypothetical protein